jgi:hypothetical protein
MELKRITLLPKSKNKDNKLDNYSLTSKQEEQEQINIHITLQMQ